MTRAALYLALLIVSNASSGDRGLYSQESSVEQLSACVDYGQTVKSLDFEESDSSTLRNQRLIFGSYNGDAIIVYTPQIRTHQQVTFQAIRAPPNNKVFKIHN